MHKWHVCVDATTEEKLRIVAPKLTKLRAMPQLENQRTTCGRSSVRFGACAAGSRSGIGAQLSCQAP